MNRSCDIMKAMSYQHTKESRLEFMKHHSSEMVVNWTIFVYIFYWVTSSLDRLRMTFQSLCIKTVAKPLFPISQSIYYSYQSYNSMTYNQCHYCRSTIRQMRKIHSTLYSIITPSKIPKLGAFFLE